MQTDGAEVGAHAQMSLPERHTGEPAHVIKDNEEHSMRPWPSVRSLFNVDALDNVLRELANSNAAQKSQVMHLHKAFTSKADIREVQNIEARLQSLAGKLSSELQAINTQLSLPGRQQIRDDDASSPFLGRVVSWQLRRLEQIKTALDRKASQERCDDVYERLYALYASLQRTLQTEHAKIHDVDILRDAHSELARQVSLVQQMLGSKVDKSELPHLESLVDRVRSFISTHKDLLQRAESAEARLQVAESTLAQQTQRIEVLESSLSQMMENFSRDQARLAERLVVAQEQAENAAAAKDVENLTQSLAIAQDRLDQLSASVDNHLRPQQQQLESDYHTFSTETRKQGSEFNMSIKKICADICRMQTELETKANQKAFAALSEWSEDAKLQHTSLEKRIDFALRFIDWYSKTSTQPRASRFVPRSGTSFPTPPL